MSKFRKKKNAVYMATLLLALIFFIVGCAATGDKSAPASAPAEQARQEVATEDMAADGDMGQSSISYRGGADSPENVEIAGESGGGVQAAEGAGRRYIILNAHLTLEIEDIEEATRKIQSGVNQLGGYVASLEIYDLTRERRMGHMSVRVPQDKYAHTLEMLDELGETKNISENTSDVTMHYIDLEARIANLEAQEIRMRELLDRAENMEDILKIEKELGRIRGDLESMTAEFKHLQEKVNYSTIDIRLEERDPRKETVVDGFGSTGERIGHLLALNTNRLLEGVSNFLVVLIGSLPILIPLLVLVIIVWKISAAIRKKKRDIREQKNYSPGNIHLPGGNGKE